MPSAIRRQDGEELHLVADADYADGDIVQKAGLAGVVEGPVKLGDQMNVRTWGGYDVLSASATTFAAGAVVGWNSGTKLAVTGGTGTYDLGKAAKAKVSGDLSVRVLFNR